MSWALSLLPLWFSPASCCITQHWWDSEPELCPVLPPHTLSTPVQERQGHTGKSPTEGHKDDLETGAPLLWGQAEEIGTVQPRGEDAQRGSHRCLQNTGREATKKTEPGFSQWCPVLGPEALGTNWPTGGSPWAPGALLCCAGEEPWHRLPREAVGSPPWGSPKAAWRWAWAACAGWPCWSREARPDELQGSLPTLIILCGEWVKSCMGFRCLLRLTHNTVWHSKPLLNYVCFVCWFGVD